MMPFLVFGKGTFGRVPLLAIGSRTEIGGSTSPMTVHKVPLVPPLGDDLGTNHAEVVAV